MELQDEVDRDRDGSGIRGVGGVAAETSQELERLPARASPPASPVWRRGLLQGWSRRFISGARPVGRSLPGRVGRVLAKIVKRAALILGLGLAVVGRPGSDAVPAPVTVPELRRDLAALAEGAPVDARRRRRLRRALHGSNARARGLATILLTRLVRQGRLLEDSLATPP